MLVHQSLAVLTLGLKVGRLKAVHDRLSGVAVRGSRRLLGAGTKPIVKLGPRPDGREPLIAQRT
jgi:hypothetical protein